MTDSSPFITPPSLTATDDPFYNIGMEGLGGISPFLKAALGFPQPTATAGGGNDGSTTSALFNATEVPGLTPCLESHPHCGFLTYYSHHPSWAGVFYSEFVDSADGTRKPAARRRTLLLHIAANTAALVLCFCQVCVIPRNTQGWKRLHRVTGWAAVVLTLFGTCFGLSMGLDHAQYEQYGGVWAPLGWTSMFLLTVGTLAPGVLAGIRRDIPAHEKWMLRFFGSMWGAFLAFRLLFLVAGRLLVGSASAVTLLAVWGGGPCGIAAAEWARTRWKRGAAVEGKKKGF